MTSNNFLHKENVNTLWDVVSDEEFFKFLSTDNKNVILQVFSNNIKGFFESEKHKIPNLIDMNKKYIMLILNYIKNKIPQNDNNKIQILHDTPVQDLITYEEIHNDRKTQFEKDLVKRQEDFTNLISIPVPDVPNFSDKYNVEPIGNMDLIMKEITEKRNYEIEQINRNFNSDISNVNNWLKPQETSLKTDKFTPIKIEEENVEEYSKLNLLNLDINVNSLTKKNVSWGENIEITNIDEDTDNIFKKLKKNKKEDDNENITVINKENNNEVIIQQIHANINELNNKLDFIIELLKNK